MNSEIKQDAAVRDLLRRVKVVVAPETYTLLSLSRDDFAGLLQKSNISPTGESPYMILWDKYEVTLMLNQSDFTSLRSLVPSGKIENGFRLLTFDLVMDFAVVGFLAEVSKILANAGIAILAISAFSRDHLLVSQDSLAAALKVLGEHVDDLC